MTPSQLEAKEKIKKALALIQISQNVMGHACEEICPIDGLCPEWEHLGELYDKIHAAWYVVSDKLQSGKFDLDRDAKARFEKKSENSDGT